jgi:hypothetical protein
MTSESKTIEDLRRHLFDAIAGVKDGSVSIEKAKTISELSQVIVNTAKVEVDYVRANNGGKSRFIGISEDKGQPASSKALPNGITGVRRHLIGDD